MRQQFSLFLTASFLFLSHGVQASSIDDDNASVAQGAAVTAVTAVTSSTSEDLQCYRKINGQLEPLFDKAGKWLDPRIPVGNPSVPSPQPMTSSQNSGALDAVELAPGQPDTRSLIQKTQQEGNIIALYFQSSAKILKSLFTNLSTWIQPSNVLSIAALAPDQPDTRSLIQKTRQLGNITGLHFQGQIEILQWLAADSMGRNNLLQTCRYYRAFAHPVFGEMHSIPNELREDLNKVHLIQSIGEQTGDVGLFMRHQRSTFEQCSIQELKEAITSGYYKDTLSSKSDHGNAYRNAQFTDIRVNGDKITFDLRPSSATVEIQDQVQLRLVPLHMPHLHQITTLNLTSNALIIPPKVDHLTNLETLWLGVNKLTKSPDVQRLGKLKVLSLNNNRLTAAPVVKGLSNLRILNLINNKIASAPDLTGTQVREADLTGNPIATPSTSS